MWQYIEQAIEAETQQKFTIKNKKKVSGGDINLCYKVSDAAQHYFIKINTKEHLENFETEIYSLKQIKSIGKVATIDVVTAGISLDKSFLVLKYLPFSTPLNMSWITLGQNMAMLHKHSSHGQFGWQQDNFIGSTRQPNQWSSNWRQFFSEQRIGWQLQLLNEKSIKLGDINHIITACHDLLCHHAPTPCLVHGDFWRGNVSFINDIPIIFDPACYYGDREVDIAMTELFGVFPSDFYHGYNKEFPLESGYEQRKVVYNFYHVLNHANIFGGLYIEQAKATLSRIFSMV
jgi:fructosamine-3-kinase